ncbi:terminase small subunit [Chitiniphilus shinanonensis]|uniref:terminase small subunit n=1 Tax=Chitiniphilus shinanonensis TaxID=553088 RepID=UPI00305318D8
MAKPKSKVAAAKPGQNAAAASARYRQFVEAYIANGRNATEAAKAAGYSERTAYSQGARLLKNVEVQSLLFAREDSLAQKHALTSDVVIKSLAQVIHFDPRRLFDGEGNLKRIVDLDDDAAAVLTSVKTVQIGSPDAPVFIKELKWEAKSTAREQAMKHLGLFEKDNRQRVEFLTDDQLDERIAKLLGKA